MYQQTLAHYFQHFLHALFSFINIEKKLDILTILNEITYGISNKLIDENFSIYIFFKFIKKPNINIVQLYDENKCIKKIFEDFNFASELYG